MPTNEQPDAIERLTAIKIDLGHFCKPDVAEIEWLVAELEKARADAAAIERLEAWLIVEPHRDARFFRESFGHAPRPGFDVVLVGRGDRVVVEEWRKTTGLAATIAAALDKWEKVKP